jgi:capsid protein
MKTWLAALFLVALAVPPAVAADDLQETLLTREKALWTAWGKKDPGPTRKETVESYVQVVAGVGMTAGREAVAKAIETHNCVMKSFEFTDARLRRPAPDVAIVTYVATQDTACGGQKLPKKLFVSSTWVKRDGEWLGFQYQETPID